MMKCDTPFDFAAAHAVVGWMVKLAAPHDERAAQETALFEVGNERGNDLVHAAHAFATKGIGGVVADALEPNPAEVGVVPHWRAGSKSFSSA